MLFASTWRFAFAFGMGRMNNELRRQAAEEAAAAEAEEREDPYIGCPTELLWAAASDPPTALCSQSAHQDGASSVPLQEGVDLSAGDVAVAAHEPPLPTVPHAEGQADCAECTRLHLPYPASPTDTPSVRTSLLATPVSPEPTRGARPRPPRRCLSITLLRHVLSFHDAAAAPLPLACAAAHPVLRLAVESTGSLHIPNGQAALPGELGRGRRGRAIACEVRTVCAPSLQGLIDYAGLAVWWWRRPLGGRTGAVPALRVEVRRPPVRAGQPSRGEVGRPRVGPSPPLEQALGDFLDALARGGAGRLTGLTVHGARALPLTLLPVLARAPLEQLALPRSKLLTDAAALGHLPWLCELDLSFSTVVELSGLDAVHTPRLARVRVKGCGQLTSLHPLGELPALQEVVASQSGVRDVAGLASSRTLASASFYGCTALRDLSPLGRVPSLQELYASESTVNSIEGLRISRSLTHVGLRYCDLAALDALAGAPALRVLNVSCTPVLSIECLARAPALEQLDLGGCAQLRDLGPLGAIPTLCEVNASDSGVEQVRGLGRAPRLRVLRLNNCHALRAVPGLGEGPQLAVVELNSSGVADIEGLAPGEALERLDVSFCKRLEDLSVLRLLKALESVKVEGSAGVPLLNVRELRTANPRLRIDV